MQALHSSTLSDGLGGVELWKTDGTSENTMQIQDIAPGPSSSNPTAFTVAGPWVFFVADDGAAGPELWALDSGILSDRLPYHNGGDFASPRASLRSSVRRPGWMCDSSLRRTRYSSAA